ncbi:hypothetical protein LAZ67_19001588 [Cordylochernes scorpioides]|uniref:DUF4371 domain-containing protein n=1 Tax=Cordylochernes scorpioides TaxID=51811 RepID=A0ABY6LKP6_9ARAC|nr:hypothetical protein LAZ67_19001588 [Cordylochernes scorpioides]
MIAKHSKPFTEGDFIKECLIKAAEIVCPGSVKTFQAISLSLNTVVERVTDMARNLNDQIKEKSSCFEAFSIACDETTDGAPSMTGKTNGFVALLRKKLSEISDGSNIYHTHCIINQEVSCTKNQDITLFSDQVWLQDFSFMVEITKYLSDLNLKLQGKDQIITNMCDQVNAFKCFTPKFLYYGIQPQYIEHDTETHTPIEKVRKLAIERTIKTHEHSKQLYDIKHPEPIFKEGDQVLVKTFIYPNTEADFLLHYSTNIENDLIANQNSNTKLIDIDDKPCFLQEGHNLDMDNEEQIVAPILKPSQIT